MEYVKLGSSDLEVSRLCLGTWNMGGREGWGPEEDARSIELIRRACRTPLLASEGARGADRRRQQVEPVAGERRRAGA